MSSLRIIDGLPAFSLASQRPTINWSKVDFAALEQAGRLPRQTQRQIVGQFEQFAGKAAALGYTAISLDDLAHITSFSWYPLHLRRLLGDYHQLYDQLFNLAGQHGLAVYINSDYLFSNAAIEARLAKQHQSQAELFATMLSQAWRRYPSLAGLILRVGEHDGLDVNDHFVSQLALQTPRAANQLLRQLLPLFERHEKQLIFRTWSVGSYQLGDVIWNQRTYRRLLAGLTSPRLTISMKYGDTDFMRYLKLNPLFQETDVKLLLELQTRREWEGMGHLPSFVGWDYADYRDQLSNKPNFVGIHVWCQTGGWANNSWQGASLLAGGSFWTELNTAVTVRLFAQSETVEQAIKFFCRQHKLEPVAFTRLLRLGEQTVKQGLYIREYAEQSLYFRRTRLPSLLWLAWDRLLYNPALVLLLRTFVARPAAAVAEGQAAAKASEHMLRLGQRLGLPSAALESLRFQRDSLALLSDWRQILLLGHARRSRAQLQAAIQDYQAAYPQHYRMPPVPTYSRPKPHRLVGWALRRLVRRQAAYRPLDRLLLATSPLQAWLARRYVQRQQPDLANQSMGIDSLFK